MRQLPTPESGGKKVISGRVTKMRISPRKTIKKEYKELENPFRNMGDIKDESGQSIFAKEHTSSEDSDPTDVEFGQERKVKN